MSGHIATETIKGPEIEVWYGQRQSFGHIGNPLRWINILGRVSGDYPIASLTYSLNRGVATELAIGPDRRRLLSPGDFNIEPAIDELLPGKNLLELTAIDTIGNISRKTVVFDYTPGNVCPLPYLADWSGAHAIGDVAQVTDGLWTLDSGDARTVGIGYDRLIAIGDISWRDYEVTVPITIHGFDTSSHGDPTSVHSAVGMVLRWQGHHDWEGERPRVGYAPAGAIAWYSWIPDLDEYRLTFMGGTRETIGFYGTHPGGKTIRHGVPTIFKVRVETQPGGTTIYSLKTWETGDPEPPEWDISAPGLEGGLGHGSLLLIAHHADATFGNVLVTGLPNSDS